MRFSNISILLMTLALNSNPISQYLFEIVEKLLSLFNYYWSVKGVLKLSVETPAPLLLLLQQLSLGRRRVKVLRALGLGKGGGLSKFEMPLEIELEDALVTSILLTIQFSKDRCLMFDFGTNTRK